MSIRDVAAERVTTRESFGANGTASEKDPVYTQRWTNVVVIHTLTGGGLLKVVPGSRTPSITPGTPEVKWYVCCRF